MVFMVVGVAEVMVTYYRRVSREREREGTKTLQIATARCMFQTLKQPHRLRVAEPHVIAKRYLDKYRSLGIAMGEDLGYV